MKHVPRIAVYLIFAALPFVAMGCGSSTKREATLPDAQATTDVPISDAPGMALDSASAATLPDAGVLEVAGMKPDTIKADTSGASLDTSPTKLDTARPDRLEADTITASPDTAPAKTDTAIPDTLPARTDAQATDTVFHCPADAGPAALTRLSPLELKTLLDGNEDPFLINVKGATIGKIPGTDAVLVSDIPGIEALVGGDLCANIILYCQSGNTSKTVADQLIAKGYRRIRDLTGGITAWKAAGYPTL